MRILLTLFAALTLTALIGCGRAPVMEDEPATAPATPEANSDAIDPAHADYNPEAPVATVNTNVLTAGQLEKEVDIRIENAMQAHSLTPGQKQEFKDQNRAAARTNVVRQFVIKTVLMDEAIRLNVQVDEKDRKEVMERIEAMCKARNKTVEEYFSTSAMGEERMRKEFEDSLLINKLVKMRIDSIADATEADIHTFRARADKVRVNRRNYIEGIRRELLDGASFAEVAKAKSEDVASKAKGGDLGVFRRNQMAPEFEEAAFSQKIGEIGPVVRTKFGYHIIKVSARIPAQKDDDGKMVQPETCSAQHILIRVGPPLTGDQIKSLLKRERTDVAAKEYVKALMKEAKVSLGMKNVKF